MIHVGLVGAGNISRTHAEAASQIDGAKLVAVCGRSTGSAGRLAAPFGAAAYDDLARFLNHRPMVLVVIGTLVLTAVI